METTAEGTAASREAAPAWLDRPLDLTAVTWAAVGWLAAVVVAVALRLVSLDVWALGTDEARRAYDAYILYAGLPEAPGSDLPTVAPLPLLLQAFGFFLFGVTDVTARLAPALLGLGLVPLAYALRPFVGRAAALGMAALLGFSPTLVYASRTADPEIAVAFFALLLVVAVLRAGLADGGGVVRRWAVIAGAAAGALLASGPSAVTVLITLGVGAITASLADQAGALPRGLRAVARTPGAWPAALAALVATGLVLFTRLFSDIGAIVGVGETFADWGRLLVRPGGAGETPTQFFLLSILLYEPLAMVLALVALVRGRLGRSGGLGWPFFAAWFGAALVLWSFSTGRAPEHAVHVALPLVLLAGGVLGDLVAALDRRVALRGRGGGLFLAYLGTVVALISFAILWSRVDRAVEADQDEAVLQVVLVGAAVVVPLAYLAVNLVGAERRAGRARQPVLLALLVFTLLLGAYTLRSSVLLNFHTADDGTELLAQRTATAAVEPAVDRLRRLSRDATVDQGSVRDPTGGHGLSIAADRTVQWPFRWYFRDFPDFSAEPTGQAALAGARVVIAPDDTGMAEAGYAPREVPYLHRVPGVYLAPDTGDLLLDLVRPGHWLGGARYLLYRDGLTEADPATVAIGYDGELAAVVTPFSGPYSLGERPGPGTGRGQFNQPIGVAVAPETADNAGTIYVVDSGNRRVERFDDGGGFVGLWGGEEGALGLGTLETSTGALGPTGIAVGPDGLVYLADTWNHRIVVLNPNGDVIREIGIDPARVDEAAAADTTDDPALVTTKPGLFFGPRAIAVTEDEIYVVDTGNERVQVFAKDGTFRRAWGGKGSTPGQLIEPVGIALGPDGRVYVADSGNGRISVFTGEGEPLRQWPVASWVGQDYFQLQPYLAFGGDDNLYATSSIAGTIEVFTRAGAPVRTIDTVEGVQPQRPIGIANAPNGDLLVTDGGRHAVLRYTPPAPPAPPPAATTDEPPIEVVVDPTPASEPAPEPPPSRPFPAPPELGVR